MSLAAITSEVENLVHGNGFADAQALKVFSISTTRAASQRHTEHVHRKSTTILDARFHTDMNELSHAHPPRETHPESIVVWLLSRVHSGVRRAAQAWQKFCCIKVFVSVGRNAEAMEPNAYHENKHWDNDDSTNTVVHCEWRIDVRQNRKASKVDPLQRSKDKDQCDPEADSEDEELPGVVSFAGFILSLLCRSAGFMAKTDAACVSATCQFAILIAPKERESITKFVW